MVEVVVVERSKLMFGERRTYKTTQAWGLREVDCDDHSLCSRCFDYNLQI